MTFIPDINNLLEAKKWACNNIKANISGFENSSLKNIIDFLEFIYNAENTHYIMIPAKIIFGGREKGALADYDPCNKIIHLPKIDRGINERIQKLNYEYKMIMGKGIPYYSFTNKIGLFYHELAHALDHNANLDYRRYIDDLPEPVKLSINCVSFQAKEKLFDGTPVERCGEGFAECFAAYITDSPCKIHIPQEIVTKIKQIIKKEL